MISLRIGVHAPTNTPVIVVFAGPSSPELSRESVEVGRLDREQAEALLDALDDAIEELDKAASVARRPTEPHTAEGHFVPEGDERCGIKHRHTSSVCMKRRGHDGPHGNLVGTWSEHPGHNEVSTKEER